MPADRVLAPFGRRSLAVTANRPSGSYRLVEVADPSGPVPRAGQFYMLAAAHRWDSDGERPYLPRAFSVARAEDGLLGFLVDVVGPGTERLATLETGEDLLVVGPLGRPFSILEGRRALLVGGGIGVAPLAVLERTLRDAGGEPELILGFRDRDHLGGTDLFLGEPVLVTDDGHAGRQALVTEPLAEHLAAASPGEIAVYACGPPAMLEGVRALAAEQGAECELAMESGMACGFGACFGCVVPTHNGFIRLCVDGPVLDASLLETALVPGTGH